MANYLSYCKLLLKNDSKHLEVRKGKTTFFGFGCQFYYRYCTYKIIKLKKPQINKVKAKLH